ncbi:MULTISPECIES: hypothetical protein [Amycolatopsis]|uniref:Uncharacterized protein n=1 Tax=Amycolatopsis dendrobii TaxID=2760662 RepID=A0A7W3VRB8_9PSEU|nr:MULTISPECIES: hypothetical protein [Amycolatopsis]MBB1151773.1 hypothetical protein [Amycolatopsis dendrobii]UKD58015.1 hypothetical protein L3Q65_15210 [Amycolatopsis sp. FU40]
MDPSAVRSLPAAALRDAPRLDCLQETTDLVPLTWRLAARSSDGRTLVFLVNLGEQKVEKVVGARVAETAASVSVIIYGKLYGSTMDHAAHSLIGQFMVDLESPIGGRGVSGSPEK